MAININENRVGLVRPMTTNKLQAVGVPLDVGDPIPVSSINSVKSITARVPLQRELGNGTGIQTSGGTEPIAGNIVEYHWPEDDEFCQGATVLTTWTEDLIDDPLGSRSKLHVIMDCPPTMSGGGGIGGGWGGSNPGLSDRGGGGGGGGHYVPPTPKPWTDHEQRLLEILRDANKEAWKDCGKRPGYSSNSNPNPQPCCFTEEELRDIIRSYEALFENKNQTVLNNLKWHDPGLLECLRQYVFYDNALECIEEGPRKVVGNDYIFSDEMTAWAERAAKERKIALSSVMVGNNVDLLTALLAMCTPVIKPNSTVANHGASIEAAILLGQQVNLCPWMRAVLEGTWEDDKRDKGLDLTLDQYIDEVLAGKRHVYIGLVSMLVDMATGEVTSRNYDDSDDVVKEPIFKLNHTLKDCEWIKKRIGGAGKVPIGRRGNADQGLLFVRESRFFS